ncbi:hypothetical protein [Solirubrum puertoriconensis]|uniref:Gliding motility-associated protein GldM first immunoglobulin-like domain-containing protein n=1 Tax=Solirubrum puertoriconensis TaxID=1751427 RepID=A0A9X0L5T3_SOLP1|nr:hypothetical protein [Solirubrum puertoriconensis]KUG09037.1 hypothetical protein ASU33_19630 [Solirubrum puertoriconensis]
MYRTFTLISRRCFLLLLGCVGACRPASSDADRHQLEQLDAALQAVNQAQAASSVERLDLLGEVFDQHGASDDALREQVFALHDRTSAELAYLRQLRQRLHAPASAGDAGSLTGSEADTLRGRLRSYAQYVQQYVPAAGGSLGLDVKDDMDIQSVAGKQLNDQSFGEFYFKGNSEASSSAMLSLHEHRVLRLEHDALAKLSERVGPRGLFFEKIAPFAVPEAQTVRAGETYRAQLFLAAASPGVRHLKLEVNGLPVAMDPGTGSGRVSFRVPADAPAGPAVWEGKLRASYRGRPVTFPLRVPYQIKAQ